MKRKTIISCLLMALFFLVGVVDAQDQPVSAKKKIKKSNKQICITFDDLPVVRVHDRIERLKVTDRILETLEEFNAPAAGFVVGRSITGDQDIIRSWLEAGHAIGNHTWSHPDLNEIPLTLYLQDIARGAEAIEALLDETGQRTRYFRYPFLHRGTNAKIRQAVLEYLDTQGYRIAPVSIDTEDYIYNLQYEKTFELSDSLEMIQVGGEYIDHVLERLEEAERLADDIVGRPIKHILLLHANRINGEFLVDLMAEISYLGYNFITLDNALSDPVYNLSESYIGPMGISYLERLARSDPDLLPARDR